MAASRSTAPPSCALSSARRCDARSRGGLGFVPGCLSLLGQLSPPGIADGDGVVEGVKRALPGGQGRRLRRQPRGLRLESLGVGVRLPRSGGQAGRIGLEGGRERGGWICQRPGVGRGDGRIGRVGGSGRVGDLERGEARLLESLR